jgi:hypothetical protein
MSISRRCRRRYSGPAICSSIDLGALRGRSNGSAQLCIYGDIKLWPLGSLEKCCS